MGIRPSISAVYTKDPKTGQRVLTGYAQDGATQSQMKKGITPKKDFGINTPKQVKTVQSKTIKAKEAQEKLLKRKGPVKKKSVS